MMKNILTRVLFLSVLCIFPAKFVQAEGYVDYIARQTQQRMCQRHGGAYCSDRYFNKWRNVASRHCDMIRTLSRRPGWQGLIGGEQGYCDGNAGYRSHRFSGAYGDLSSNSNNIFYCFMLLNQSSLVIANRRDLLSCQNYIPGNMRNSLSNYYANNPSPYDNIRALTARPNQNVTPVQERPKSIYDQLDEDAAKKNNPPAATADPYP